MIRHGELLDSVAKRLAPRHTALLVVDMQNDFCAEKGYIEVVGKRDARACRAVAKPIMELVGEARRAKVPVVWIKANYEPDKIPAVMLAKRHERGITEVCCRPGTWGGDFYGVTPAAGEAIVEKNCYSGFIGTDLEARLQKLGVRTIVVSGVQTHVCVEATLRDGAMLGFYTVLAPDCAAAYSPEQHEATVKSTQAFYGDVLAKAEIAATWRAVAPAAAAS
ncbi:MAG: cysteine hydrolase [Proteobacteria bacterium]|nr:cysteine hydrolase [Pseudomonadota bacterium]